MSSPTVITQVAALPTPSGEGTGPDFGGSAQRQERHDPDW